MNNQLSQSIRRAMVIATFAGLAASAAGQNEKPKPRLVTISAEEVTQIRGGGKGKVEPRLVRYEVGGGGSDDGGDSGGDDGGSDDDGSGDGGGDDDGANGDDSGGDGGSGDDGDGGSDDGGSGDGGDDGGSDYVDEDGFLWTELSPSPDSRLIYVSSSEGNDANSGTIDRPVKTIAKAREFTRGGYPDWILLKRGDQFHEWVPCKSGRSPSERWVLTGYGVGPKPIVRGLPDFSSVYVGGANSYAAVIGIHLKAPDAGTSMDGFRIINQDATSHILIEDCVIEDYRNGINVQHGSHVAIRGNVIIDTAAPNGGHAQGIYGEGVDDLLIEGNVFDHNGWRDDGLADPTIFNHNCYLKGTADDPLVRPVVRNNIFARGSSFGCTMSAVASQGVIDPVLEGNLFIANANGFVHGGDQPSAIVNSTVRGNVFMRHGRELSSGRQSFGMELNCLNGGLVEDNYFLDTDFGGSTFSIRLNRGPQANVVIRDNISYDWFDGGLEIAGASLTNVLFDGNVIADPDDSWTLVDVSDYSRQSIDFSENAYQLGGGLSQGRFRLNGASLGFDDWRVTADEPNAQRADGLGFLDPGRTIDDYMASINSEGGMLEFLAAARLQARGSWDPQFTAEAVIEYVSQGFELSGP